MACLAGVCTDRKWPAYIAAKEQTGIAPLCRYITLIY